MKFANIEYPTGSIYGENLNEMVNLGDAMQSLAIQNLYTQMGVKENEIIRIPRSKLGTYTGEYVILPINAMFSGFAKGIDVFDFSEKIKPVFLGLAIRGDSLSPHDIEFLRRYEPIGCRDEYTFRIIQKYNIVSWLNGCITLTFPKRKPAKGKKLICVDISDSLIKYLPQGQERVFLSHIEKAQDINMENYVNERYQYYKEEAALMVTGRLHCAVPCIAAGIPTIVAKTSYETNFSWVEKWVHLYQEDEFDSIEWKVSSINLEHEKKMILDNAMQILRNTYEKYHNICDISTLYEDRKGIVFENYALNKTKEYIDNNWNKSSKISYGIWGFSMISGEVIEYLSQKYPSASLIGIFDKYRAFEYQGITSQPLENLCDIHNAKILVMGSGACEFYKNHLGDFPNDNEFYLCY